ncbi:MAG: hypothetical protein KKE81_03605, partial [Candidatus Omnitrophica bacterium]|nr:hypothetical protein [Candidatus Omnitrophota bacterium]
IFGGGKKVFPEEVEGVIGQSPYIKELCVMARTATRGIRKGHEEVYAVIVPNSELFTQENISAQEDITGRISSEIARLSKDLAPYKRIVNFRLSDEELPKTATKKIIRSAVSGARDK